MKKDEAVKIAIECIEQKGYDVRQYTFKTKRINNDWEIYFYRKMIYKPSPGDFLTVCIDVKSKQVSRIFEGK